MDTGTDAGPDLADAAIIDDASDPADATRDSADPNPLNHPTMAEVRAVLEAELLRSGDPGGVIAVSIGDEVVIEAAAGVLRAGGSPVVTSAHFQAGSVTKMFTAALIMKLVEDGTLTLTDSIDRWTSVQIAAPHTVSSQTLDLLLSHRAGHPNAAPEDELFALPCEPGRAGSVVIMQRLDPQMLEGAPASGWSYSNHGFNLAGFVAQEAAGRYFADLMRQEIFLPTGMMNATFDEATADMRAEGHTDGVPLDFGPEAPCGYFDPAGAVTSLPVGDLVRFGMLIANTGGPALSTESAVVMRTARSPAYGIEYGYGTFIRTLHGEVAVGHPGDTYGFVAHLETIPAHRIAVAVMFNGDRADPTQVADDVLGLYLN